MSGATLTVQMGDNSHSAVVTNLNLDSSPATGVSSTFDTSDSSIVVVAPNSGALTPVAPGTATITVTSVRGAFTHTDTGVVTVTANTADDFTTSLTFS